MRALGFPCGVICLLSQPTFSSSMPPGLKEHYMLRSMMSCVWTLECSSFRRTVLPPAVFRHLAAHSPNWPPVSFTVRAHQNPSDQAGRHPVPLNSFTGKIHHPMAHPIRPLMLPDLFHTPFTRLIVLTCTAVCNQNTHTHPTNHSYTSCRAVLVWQRGSPHTGFGDDRLHAGGQTGERGSHLRSRAVISLAPNYLEWQRKEGDKHRHPGGARRIKLRDRKTGSSRKAVLQHGLGEKLEVCWFVRWL